MFRKKLCPHCKTGKCSYELDPRSPVCPYLSCHNGKKCSMFKMLDEPEKWSFLNRILKGYLLPPPKIEPVTAFLSPLYGVCLIV